MRQIRNVMVTLLAPVILFASCGAAEDGPGVAAQQDTRSSSVPPTVAVATPVLAEPTLVMQSELATTADQGAFCGSIRELQDLVYIDASTTAEYLEALQLLEETAPAGVTEDALIATSELFEAFEALGEVRDASDAEFEAMPSPHPEVMGDFAASLVGGEPLDGSFSAVLAWANDECDGFPMDPLHRPDPERSIAGSELFVDPEGAYEIEIDPGWTSSHGSMVKGVEAWIVGSHPEFAPNISIMTQSAPRFTLRKYMDVSLRGADALENFELIESRITNGIFGQELGSMEFLAGELHFLQYYLLVDDEAVVVTLSAANQEFDRVRSEVEPYLITFMGIE